MTKQTHTLSHKERQILVIALVGIWAIIMCENWFFLAILFYYKPCFQS